MSISFRVTAMYVCEWCRDTADTEVSARAIPPSEMPSIPPGWLYAWDVTLVAQARVPFYLCPECAGAFNAARDGRRASAGLPPVAAQGARRGRPLAL
jgi:hypothetical protein